MTAPAPARAPESAACLLAAMGGGYEAEELVGTTCTTCRAQGITGLLTARCGRTGEFANATLARLRAEAGAAPFGAARARIEAISDRARHLHQGEVDARIAREALHTGRILDSREVILERERGAAGWQRIHHRYHTRAAAELALEREAAPSSDPHTP
jgi:hypothetical protein